MPLKTGLALSLAFACSSVLSASPACVASAERAAQDAAILAPPLAYQVIGTGHLDFHSAPDAACRIAGTFVIARDRLVGNHELRGWTSVMFMTRAGDDVQGWVRSERLKVTGTLGPTAP